MGLKICSLEHSDLPRIQALLETAEQELGLDLPAPNSYLTRYRFPDGCFFMMELDGQLVGCGGLRLLDSAERHSCVLEYLYILPDWRGQELGASLLSSLLHQARKRGFKHCYLAAQAKQQPLLRLCLQSGFVMLNEPVSGLEGAGFDTWMKLEL